MNMNFPNLWNKTVESFAHDVKKEPKWNNYLIRWESLIKEEL